MTRRVSALLKFPQTLRFRGCGARKECEVRSARDIATTAPNQLCEKLGFSAQAANAESLPMLVAGRLTFRVRITDSFVLQLASNPQRRAQVVCSDKQHIYAL